MNTENSIWKLLNELATKSGISEIIINNVDNVYIERDGELIRLNVNFSPEDLVGFCKEVAQFNKRLFNRDNPILDGLLPDGSRVNIVSSAYTASSPAITIRKYLRNISSFEDSPNSFGMNAKIVSFLKALVASRQNIMISGGTSSGKTTLLNLLMQELGLTERIVTIEDVKELQFQAPNTVRLLTANVADSVESPLGTRELLKNCLRMRPDRIIIGEVRGAEAFDLLQAMNTGHQGSMCTIHANSPSESLSRLENLFLFAGFDVPLRAVRRQISNALDFLIQLDRNSEGVRVIKKISEVNNMEGENVLLQDIVVYEENGPDFTGLVPSRFKALVRSGLSPDFFV